MNIRFFVTGHGRSGTKWLARLLNTDPTVCAHHEPINSDAQAYHRILAGAQDADDYLQHRVVKMQRIRSRNPHLDYAEVNSYLRYFTASLSAAFPAPIVALIRDGRYVVRSMLSRGIYSKPNYPPIPAPHATPFENCCWYWATTYRDHLPHLFTFRLEDLNASHATFTKLCALLSTTVTYHAWQRNANRPTNVDVDDPHPPDWTAAQRALFTAIAGDIQEKFYP